MPTLSFWDQLKIEFGDHWSAYCHYFYSEKANAKKIKTKKKQSITLTHNSHLQVWLAVWHLQKWHSVMYLIFDSAIV